MSCMLPDEQSVPFAHVVVLADEELPVIDAIARLAVKIVSSIKVRGSEIPRRPELEQALRLRRDAAGWNLIVGEWLPGNKIANRGQRS